MPSTLADLTREYEEGVFGDRADVRALRQMFNALVAFCPAFLHGSLEPLTPDKALQVLADSGRVPCELLTRWAHALGRPVPD